MLFLIRISRFFQKTFALWVLVFAGLAFMSPEMYAPLVKYIPWLLGIVMFGMGVTMTVDDFKGVLKHPKAVFIGTVAQFFIMPL